MRISVIGCGYLGAVHAVCMASLGHEVVGIDVDAGQIGLLERGEAPFFEPDLPELLAQERRAGRLTFATDIQVAAGAAVHFICVGTPQLHGEYAADLSYVNDAFTNLLDVVRPGDVIVGKSTVPVGTAERLASELAKVEPAASLVWNPEFLREGFAVEDTLHPDRIIYGQAKPDDERPVEILDAVYARALSDGTPRIVTDLATAQLVKVAANSFLATKISFINAMAELCEASGGDVTQLADAIGLDKRIGRSFLNAGLGFGGGCLPKDIRAFMARAGELGVDQALTFLREVDSINMRRRVRMVDLAREELGGSVAGRRIAVLGAAFKPNSDDIRDSPALSVAAQLQLQGAVVTVTDPEAIPNARRKWPDIRFADLLEDALRDAELVLVLTEWQEYVALDPDRAAKLVARNNILDGRNCLAADKWRAAGWAYRALGRH